MTDEMGPPPDQPTEAPPPQADRDSGLSWGLAVFLLASLVFVTFVVQNSEAVAVTFLNFEGRFSLSVILVVTALVAVVADEVFGVMRRRRRRRLKEDREELARFRRS
jgi:uncharacterized integral membrane protein